MSNLVKSKSMSNIKKELWNNKMNCYIFSVINIPMGRSQRLRYLKEIFDFMMSDLWWIIDDNEELIKKIKEKLFDFRKNRAISQYYREYFRNVEEKFGFAIYCCSNTGYYRCETTIIKGEKNKFCKLHSKILDIKSERIAEILGSRDVSMLIAEYM